MGLLKAAFLAFQTQCFNPENGEYTGFQCPNNYKKCPLKAGDGREIEEAYSMAKRELELHHNDGARFSSTGTTNPGQVVAMCSDCHTLLHEDDPSASRFSRR